MRFACCFPSTCYVSCRTTFCGRSRSGTNLDHLSGASGFERGVGECLVQRRKINDNANEDEYIMLAIIKCSSILNPVQYKYIETLLAR